MLPQAHSGQLQDIPQKQLPVDKHSSTNDTRTDTTSVTEHIIKHAKKNEEILDQHFQDLEDFKAKHGHVRVPFKYPPKSSLGSWLNNIKYKGLRDDHPKRNKDSTVRTRRPEQLEAHAVSFSGIPTTNEDIGNLQNQELKNSKRGHVRVLIHTPKPLLDLD